MVPPADYIRALLEDKTSNLLRTLLSVQTQLGHSQHPSHMIDDHLESSLLGTRPSISIKEDLFFFNSVAPPFKDLYFKVFKAKFVLKLLSNNFQNQPWQLKREAREQF